MQVEKKKRRNQSWKSFYLSCRRHLPCRPSSSSSNDDRNLPINPISLHKNPPLLLANSEENNKKSSSHFSQNKTTQMQWQRVSELERELAELEEWLHTELTRLKSHFGSYFNPNNNENFCAKKKVNFDGKLERLDGDGGYLYTLDDGMSLVCGGSSSQDLVIQFSSPTIVPLEYGSNIFEVLNQMEKMPRDNLTAWLLKSSPIANISSNNKPLRQSKAHILSKVPRDFEEAVLKNTVSWLGELIIRGLQIQMGVKKVKKSRNGKRQKEGKIDDHHSSRREEFTIDGGGIIMAMLIQPRDPQKGYQAIHNRNEVMLGFVEVEDDKESGFLILGQIHVAQFRARRRNGNGNGNGNGHVMYGCVWCISMSS